MDTRMLSYEKKPLMNVEGITEFFEEKNRALSAMDEIDEDNKNFESNEMMNSNVSDRGNDIYVISYRNQSSFSRRITLQFQLLNKLG